MMNDITWWQSLAIVFAAAMVLWMLIGPWLSLFDLKHLIGIENELRKIREELVRQRRRDDG